MFLFGSRGLGAVSLVHRLIAVIAGNHRCRRIVLSLARTHRRYRRRLNQREGGKN